MRHLFALLLLSLGLAACDDSTTAPTDTIPGPPNAPRLTLTVLTGTKAAPVDSPTVKVEWAYTDSVKLYSVASSAVGYSWVKVLTSSSDRFHAGIGNFVLKIGCNGDDSAKFSSSIDDYLGRSVTKYDSLIVHCK